MINACHEKGYVRAFNFIGNFFLPEINSEMKETFACPWQERSKLQELAIYNIYIIVNTTR